MTRTLKDESSHVAHRAKLAAASEIVKDWSHFHASLETMRDTAWIFRGVTSPTHYLVPSIGRESVYGHYKRAQEERLFREFKDRAIYLLTIRDSAIGIGWHTLNTSVCQPGCLTGQLVRW